MENMGSDSLDNMKQTENRETIGRTEPKEEKKGKGITKDRRKRYITRVSIILLMLLFCLVQNKWLTVSHYTYQSGKVPETFEGYRIVQISDLHNARFGIDNRWLVSKVQELQPDMIVLTGDIVDSGFTNMEVAISFAAQAVQFCPTYYVTGNHENWLSKEDKDALINGLKAAGVVCLSDEAVSINKDGATISLIGLDNESLWDNTLQNVVAELPADELKILLAHEPQYFDKYVGAGVDLVFSGHAHGGQFRLPFIGGLVAPGQGLFPKYTEGQHMSGDTTMIISRGLGNSIIPVRLFNLPEIVCVELER